MTARFSSPVIGMETDTSLAVLKQFGTGFSLALPDGTQATLERVEPIGVNPIRRWDSFYNALMRACRPALQQMPARVRPHTNTGTQIYVDPTVVGPGTGTLGDPYRSLVTAMLAVAANQSVLIRAGTTAAPTPGALYTNASGASATAAIVIGVYQPVTGARVFNSVGAATIDCAGTANNAFYMDARSFICFDGIRFINKPAGAGAYVVFVGASGNNQILNCEAVNSTANAFELAGTIGSDVVEGCLITGNIIGVAIGITASNSSVNYNVVVGAVASVGAIQLFQAGAALTGCTVAGNSIRGTSVPGNYGIRVIAGSANVRIFGNSISLVSVGVSLGDLGVVSGDFSGTIIENNYILNAGEFGVHLFGATGSVIVQANRVYRTGSYNGTTSPSPDLYARAVEIWGVNGTTRMTRDIIVRFNVFAGTFNFINNGSEGVGLGFDDFSANCTGYANVCVDNEGNGIQFFNNRSNTATGNLVVNNNYQPVSRNQTWVTNFQGQIVSEKANFHLIANNTVVCYGFANQRFGISFRDEGTGSRVSNNLIIGASERGIVLDPALVVESHNIIESSPIAVANLALVQIANGTGTTAVAAGASALQGLLFTPPSGGICDNTGSVTFARMSSLQGVPLGVRTPIGASHASA